MNESSETLFVVSNRLPITCTKDENGSWNFSMSSGGLVACLEGVKRTTKFIWVGWPGLFIPEGPERTEFTELLFQKFDSVPVWIEEEVMTLHYNSMCNSVIWPLFHYNLQNTDLAFDTEAWNAYKFANEKFAEAVANICGPSDRVWVHDYHLLLFPALFKLRMPEISISFFLHIPFASSEIFRAIPVKKQILRGVLACNLVGFHTWDYARHFVKSCTRILGAESVAGGVLYKGNHTTCGTFPVGIDPDKFSAQLKLQEFKERLSELKHKFKGRKVILGVDRLDYIKGIPHKFHAYEKFLITHPEWIGKVVLIQLCIPSREDVEEYINLKEETDILVGKINSTYVSNDFHLPVEYLYKSVPFNELCALYSLADCCLITSIRDGMNIVSQEYVACQEGKEEPGSLMLSEFTGSVQSLSGATLINPYNTNQVAEAIFENLNLTIEEKQTRHEMLYQFISTHTAAFWGENFMKEFNNAIQDAAQSYPQLPKKQLLKAYKKSKKRLILIDNDALVSSKAAVPQIVAPSSTCIDILTKLCSYEENNLFITSIRGTKYVETCYKDIKAGFFAEHGFFFKPKNETSWIRKEVPSDWLDDLNPVLQAFKERTPGSHLDQREGTVTWYYGNTDSEFGDFKANELALQLESMATLPINIEFGNKAIEISHWECTASNMLHDAKQSIEENEGDSQMDFLLYIGKKGLEAGSLSNLATEDYSDRTFICVVGKKLSDMYHLRNSKAVLNLLDSLIQCK